MITKGSIDLKRATDPCVSIMTGGCRALTKIHDGCGSYKCPFYKPDGCKDWARIEDRTGVNLIPPEDWRI